MSDGALGPRTDYPSFFETIELAKTLPKYTRCQVNLFCRLNFPLLKKYFVSAVTFDLFCFFSSDTICIPMKIFYRIDVGLSQVRATTDGSFSSCSDENIILKHDFIIVCNIGQGNVF